MLLMLRGVADGEHRDEQLSAHQQCPFGLCDSSAPVCGLKSNYIGRCALPCPELLLLERNIHGINDGGLVASRHTSTAANR